MSLINSGHFYLGESGHYHLGLTLEFHYTPKHGSWLNIAEIELAVLSNMCLTQRIPDKDHLRREIEANVNARNAKACSRQLALHLSGCSSQNGTFVSSFFKLTDY